jgi:hypothetical protein
MRPVRAHVFRGHRWAVRKMRRSRSRDGEADGPHIKCKEVLISMGRGTRGELEIAIHESLHVCAWDLDEECVSETARDIAKLLWRLGWRNTG